MQRILMIEDNEMNRDMLSRRLKGFGYDVTIAVDGEQGVAMARVDPPDLVLMDMSLPGLDGWEATKLLRSAPRTQGIPIIALTAHAIGSDRERAIDAGCNDYDTKPVEITRLLGKIQKILGPMVAPAPVIVPEPAAVIVEEPVVVVTEPETPKEKTGDTVKILLVEDNEMNRDMLSRRLVRYGYEVAIAVDGEQGVAMAHSEVPDLILMDMSLPGLDGWEATKLLKSMPGLRRIPIIALTAHAMMSDREKAIGAGCDDYDTKPVEIKRLLTKIESWLERSGVRPPEKT